MLCPKCSRENPDRNKFCNGCGETLEMPFVPPVQKFAPPVQAFVPPPPPLEKPRYEISSPEILEPEPKKVPTKLWILGGILAAAMLGLIGAAGWFLNVSNQTNQTKNVNNPANQSASKPTDTKTSPSGSFEGMAFVPGGEFMMGRDDGKSEAEKPSRKVTVDPFHMDIYEITNEQYAKFIKAAGNKPPTEWKGGNYPSSQANFPVVGVNWEDANAYAAWARKRLPTEEEWEFAARGTSNYLYPWGNGWQAGNANAEGASQTFMEVGKSKGASPFGIYDMSGNAWEWTASDFKAYPSGSLPAAFAGKTNLKTIRGGSFEATRDFATATYRIGWAATGADSYSRTGFRCVKDVER